MYSSTPVPGRRLYVIEWIHPEFHASADMAFSFVLRCSHDQRSSKDWLLNKLQNTTLIVDPPKVQVHCTCWKFRLLRYPGVLSTPLLRKQWRPRSDHLTFLLHQANTRYLYSSLDHFQLFAVTSVVRRMMQTPDNNEAPKVGRDVEYEGMEMAATVSFVLGEICFRRLA